MRLNDKGMTLPVVMMLLVVMTSVGVGMYKLVSSSIAVSTGFQKRATARGVAVASAALIMDTVANSITGGTLAPSRGLGIVSGDITDLYGSEGNDNATDSPTNDPDFEINLGCTQTDPMCNVRVTADVDFLQAVPVAGGAMEFASAYDGVGAGQTLNSGFIISEMVHIIAVDRNTGGRSEIRFQAVH